MALLKKGPVDATGQPIDPARSTGWSRPRSRPRRPPGRPERHTSQRGQPDRRGVPATVRPRQRTRRRDPGHPPALGRRARRRASRRRSRHTTPEVAPPLVTRLYAMPRLRCAHYDLPTLRGPTRRARDATAATLRDKSRQPYTPRGAGARYGARRARRRSISQLATRTAAGYGRVGVGVVPLLSSSNRNANHFRQLNVIAIMRDRPVVSVGTGGPCSTGCDPRRAAVPQSNASEKRFPVTSEQCLICSGELGAAADLDRKVGRYQPRQRRRNPDLGHG